MIKVECERTRYPDALLSKQALHGIFVDAVLIDEADNLVT